MNELNPSLRVPPPLEAVVRRCMAKGLDERYASMDEVLVALKQASGLSATLSGEYRLGQGELANVQLEQAYSPGSSGAQISSEMLSGGTPSGRGQVPYASGQMPSLAAPVQPKRNNTPLLLGAIATLAIVGGFLVMGEAKPSADSPTVQAEPVAGVDNPSAGSEPAAVAPIGVEPSAPSAVAAQQPAPAAQPVQATTVLVSLRSTPPGAMVVVGGKEYGPTPTQVEWTGAEAVFGREVTFRFQRKGYRDLTVTRQIRNDRLEVEAPPMDPIPVRRPTREDRPSASPATPKPAAPTTTVTPVKGYKSEPY